MHILEWKLICVMKFPLKNEIWMEMYSLILQMYLNLSRSLTDSLIH